MGRRPVPTPQQLESACTELHTQCGLTWAMETAMVVWENEHRRLSNVLRAIDQHLEFEPDHNMLALPPLQEPGAPCGDACSCCGMRASLLTTSNGTKRFRPAPQCQRRGVLSIPASELRRMDFLQAEIKMQASLATRYAAQRDQCMTAVPHLTAQVALKLPVEQARRLNSKNEYLAACRSGKVYSKRKKMWVQFLRPMLDGTKTLTLRPVFVSQGHSKIVRAGYWHVLEDNSPRRVASRGVCDAIRYTSVERVTWGQIRTDVAMKTRVVRGEGLMAQYSDVEEAFRHLEKSLMKMYRPPGGWQDDDEVFEVRNGLAQRVRDNSLWDLQMFEFHRIFENAT